MPRLHGLQAPASQWHAGVQRSIKTCPGRPYTPPSAVPKPLHAQGLISPAEVLGMDPPACHRMACKLKLHTGMLVSMYKLLTWCSN